MKKTIMILSAILIFAVAGFYFYSPNSEPKPGEPIDNIQNKIKNICNLNEDAFNCNGEYSCEGQTIDFEAYTMSAYNHYAFQRTVPGRAWLSVVNYGDLPPKTNDDYQAMRQNGKYVHQIHILEEGKGEELKEKLKLIETDDFIPVKIIIKNAIIVGMDMPTNNDCTRGLNFEVKAEDISFEKIN